MCMYVRACVCVNVCVVCSGACVHVVCVCACVRARAHGRVCVRARTTIGERSCVAFQSSPVSTIMLSERVSEQTTDGRSETIVNVFSLCSEMESTKQCNRHC